MDYYAIVTNKGREKIASALQSGTALTIDKFCIGDGGGSSVTPSASQTALVNQKWIGNVTSFTHTADTISATTLVPANVGTFIVREMGIIDSDGDLFAVANVPDTVKNNSSSVLSTLNLTINVKIDNTEAISFKIIESNNDYVVCNTAADIANKTASYENFALSKGKRVVVKFAYKNTAEIPTLNINNTGAKALRSGGVSLKANMLLANQPYELVYDGTAYEIVGAVVTTQIVPISLGKDTVSLNTLTEIGDYYAGGGNNVVDFPAGAPTSGATKVGGLTLRVCQLGDSGRLQIFINSNGLWLRTSKDILAKTWNGWIKAYNSANPVKINNTIFDGANDIIVPPAFTALVSKDLNAVITQGFYGGGASNNCTNMPTGVSTFMLIVSRNTSGTGYTQLLVDTATQKMYIRNYYNQKWQNWVTLSVEGHTHSNTEITGLGNCATRNLATTVAQGNANPITSSAVYSAINNLNINNRTHIVVASYDTKNPLKTNADYTCTSTNASSVLKTAINAVAIGGTVELLDGTYNLQYGENAIELTRAINIVGAGYTTKIKQPVSNNEAKPIFIISGENIKLSSMMLSDENVTSPVAMIEQQAQGAIYDDVFFIFNAAETSSYGACIKGSNDCNFTRIQNCRVYKSFINKDIVMFDFSDCTKFCGVIGANISSGYDNISVRFANESHKNNTAVYGHTAIDLLTK